MLPLTVSDREELIMDTGAERHMLCDLKYFTSLTPTKVKVGPAEEGTNIAVTRKGTAEIPVMSSKGPCKLTLHDCLYTPTLRTNLLAYCKFQDAGFTMQMSSSGQLLTSPQGLSFPLQMLRGTLTAFRPSATALAHPKYSVTVSAFHTTVNDTVTKPTPSKAQKMAALWHRRLGHRGDASVIKTLEQHPKENKGVDFSGLPAFCVPCVEGKSSVRPLGDNFYNDDYEPAVRSVSKPPTSERDVHYTDLLGPVRPAGLGLAAGVSMAIGFFHQASGLYRVIGISKKVDVLLALQIHHSNSGGIRHLRCDNEAIYKEAKLQAWCAEHSIKLEYSAPYTPQQNGVAERAWRTLSNGTISLLSDSGLPTSFWFYAMQHVVHVHNRMARQQQSWLCPLEKYSGVRPPIRHLRVFGCRVLITLPSSQRGHKFSTRTVQGFLVGYTDSAYKVWVPSSSDVTQGRLYESRNVTFDEGTVYKDLAGPASSTSVPRVLAPSVASYGGDLFVSASAGLPAPAAAGAPAVASDQQPVAEPAGPAEQPAGPAVPTEQLVAEPPAAPAAPVSSGLGLGQLRAALTGAHATAGTLSGASGSTAAPSVVAGPTPQVPGAASAKSTRHQLAAAARWSKHKGQAALSTAPSLPTPALPAAGPGPSTAGTAPARRGPGRPRRLPVPEPQASGSASLSAGPALVRRGVGRPRKASVSFAPQLEAGPSAAPASSQPPPSALRKSSRANFGVGPSALSPGGGFMVPMDAVVISGHLPRAEEGSHASTSGQQHYAALADDMCDDLLDDDLLDDPALDAFLDDEQSSEDEGPPEVALYTMARYKKSQPGRRAKGATSTDPSSVQDANSRPDAHHWKSARQAERQSLQQLQVLTSVPISQVPKGTTLLSSMYIHKLKTKPDGSVDKYKARLVVKGFKQKHGVDYTDTFAPVAKFTTLRTILALAAQNGWELRQFDVATAFLYADLEEEIYMTFPPGEEEYTADGEPMVALLLKSLYGLKQAPRNWFKRFTKFLISYGFVQSIRDPCLFMYYDGDELKCVLNVYVDDVASAITAEDSFYAAFIKAVEAEFKIKEGPLEYCLGLEIVQTPDMITVKQTKYIQEMLSRYNLDNSNQKPTPLPLGATFYKEDCPAVPDKQRTEEYRSMVGTLNYLVVATRPDLNLAVSLASQVLINPASQHMEWVKHIFKYLKGTTDLGITYVRRGPGRISADAAPERHVAPNELLGYSDSDWGGCKSTGRSRSGSLHMLNGGPVAWFSKKQDCVSVSSTEAEYVALCLSSLETVYLRDILADMCMAQNQPTVMYEDNTGCLQLTKDHVLHGKTKHIAIRYHKTRELVTDGVVSIKQCSTLDQLADFFTKIHGTQKFLQLRRRIMGA